MDNNMWLSSKKRKRDKDQEDKISKSQNVLKDAALTTVEMAEFVVSKLKNHLDDAIKQFDSTIAIMSDALLICDTDGHVKAINPAAQSMFLYSFDEITSLTILDLFHSHTVNICVPSDFWNILKPDTTQETIGLIGLRKNNEEFQSEVTLTRLERSDKTVVYLMLIRDITDILLLKKESEENSRRYRSLFDLTFDGIIIVQNDQIVAVNKQAERMFGCKSENLITKNFTKLVGCNKQPTADCPNSVDCVDCVKCITDKIVHKGNVIRNDGSSMPLLFSGTEILWNDSNAYLITVRDTLKQFDRRFDTGVDMICFFDKYFKITFTNESFRNFYKTEIGTDIRTTMSETKRNAFMLNISNLSVERPTKRTQFYVDLEHVHDWVDHAVYDVSNEIIEVQHSERDITDFMKEVMNS